MRFTYDYVKQNIMNYNETNINNLHDTDVGNLLDKFLKFLTRRKPQLEKVELENIVKFLSDGISFKNCNLFFEKMKKIKRNSDEFKHLTSIHFKLYEIEKYKKIYKSLCDYHDKKRQEEG